MSAWSKINVLYLSTKVSRLKDSPKRAHFCSKSYWFILGLKKLEKIPSLVMEEENRRYIGPQLNIWKASRKRDGIHVHRPSMNTTSQLIIHAVHFLLKRPWRRKKTPSSGAMRTRNNMDGCHRPAILGIHIKIVFIKIPQDKALQAKLLEEHMVVNYAVYYLRRLNKL